MTVNMQSRQTNTKYFLQNGLNKNPELDQSEKAEQTVDLDGLHQWGWSL